MTVIAVLVAVLALAVTVAAVRRVRRAGTEIAALQVELTDERRASSEVDPRIAELEAALEGLELGVVLIGARGEVVLRNEVGTRYATGHHEETLIEAAVQRTARRARSGEAAVQTVRLTGPPARVIEVGARPLAESAGGSCVVVVADMTSRVRTDEVRRDFIANLSHELRSPLGAVTVLVDALDGEPGTLTRDRLTHRIGVELERMTAIVDDLLDLSRLEFDGEARCRPVAASHLIEAAVDAVRHGADARHVKLLVEASPLTVEADESQVVRALGNLLENAVKYSDEGTTVRVEVEADEHVVRFYVHDEGIGIPQADLERIFERFYRVDTARSRETGGTGLGLAIVRHVAHNHGGDVRVRSREGEGSSFALIIPRGARS